MNDLPLALIVEDEADQAELLRVYLDRCGLRVVIVPTAERALPLLVEMHPALVFVDLILPGISGESLAQQVRATHPEAFLVITSVHDTSRYPESDAQLPKPFTGEQIRAVVERSRAA